MVVISTVWLVTIELASWVAGPVGLQTKNAEGGQ